MKKKILVCGSAGFLMSNFMRYILYRSKEFEIISVDKLIKPEDFQRVYLNRNHKFYIGDITDEYFMDRLIFIEKPNWIINGIGYFSTNLPNRVKLHSKTIIESTMLLSTKYNTPIIQLGQDKYIDEFGYNNIAKQFIAQNGTMLIIPNCFGFRQKPIAGLAKIINDILLTDTIYVHDKILPWVYAEDVASLIWYIIEKEIKGEVKMPPLGYMSIEEMSQYVCKEFNKTPKIIKIEEEVSPFHNNFWYPMCFSPNEDNISPIEYNIRDWCPDIDNLELVINKTILWYKNNSWVFKDFYMLNRFLYSK